MPPRARKAVTRKPKPVVEEPANDQEESENKVTIEFVSEVPARKAGGGGRKSDFLNSGIAEQLAQNAGAWARVATREKMGTAAGYSGRIRKTAWDGGKFESTVRQTGDEEFSVYARFNPDGDE